MVRMSWLIWGGNYFHHNYVLRFKTAFIQVVLVIM